MAETTTAAEWVPDRPTLPRPRRAAHDCRGCELWHLVACAPWLEAELDVVRPGVVVAMGATAGRAGWAGRCGSAPSAASCSRNPGTRAA